MIESASMLLLSGWAHGNEVMQPIGDALGSAPHVRCLAPHMLDQRLDYAAALRELIEPESKTVVIGWSMGGMIALEALERSPGLFSGMVLIASCASFVKRPRYPHGIAEQVLRAMTQTVRHDPAGVVQSFRDTAFPITKEMVPAAPDLSAAELERGLRYLRSTDLCPALPSVNVPVLLLHGSADTIVSCRASEHLRSGLPRSVLVSMEGADHGIIVSHANQIGREILCFMESL